VPGTVQAFFHLHRHRGRIKTADILNTIADRASQGAVLTRYEADCLNRLAPKLDQSPEAKLHYVKDTPWSAEDRLFNPALEKTLRVLAREGEAAFYRDRIADQMVSDLSRNGGHLSSRDLASYQIREQQAIALPIAGRQVWTVPPEGGGAMLLEILGLLDREAFRRQPVYSAHWHHLVAQASKLAFIHRRAYLGDVSLLGNAAYDGIFHPGTQARHFAALDPERDTPTEELARRIDAIDAIDALEGREAGPNTTHFSVIDAEGNAVSCSYTLNLRYGSKWAIAGAGFLMNGSMDSFSFAEGQENYFGVIGSRPNLFAPGKRPCSNMAPTLVTRDGLTEMALGSPGGPTIPTSLGALLAAILIHGVKPTVAVQQHRLHHQGWPDKLAFEAGFPDQALLDELAQRGYTLKDKQELISDLQGVFLNEYGYLAISDWRREGRAMALE
jgi:gamma-glutamyltranspeptidase/glutathione hydrolase